MPRQIEIRSPIVVVPSSRLDAEREVSIRASKVFLEYDPSFPHSAIVQILAIASGVAPGIAPDAAITTEPETA